MRRVAGNGRRAARQLGAIHSFSLNPVVVAIPQLSIDDGTDQLERVVRFRILQRRTKPPWTFTVLEAHQKDIERWIEEISE
jgi:hypothetical protein